MIYSHHILILLHAICLSDNRSLYFSLLFYKRTLHKAQLFS
jgi:hypothetical protein